MRRSLPGALGFAIGSGAGLVTAQVAILTRLEFLPMDPGYRVDTRLEPSSGTAPGAPLRMYVLGDSTVAGVGSPTEAESLPALIGRRVADATARPVHVVGTGVSGARMATVLADQLPLVPTGLDAIVVVVGSNDATHATPPWRFEADARALLERAARLAPVVVLAGTPRFHRNEIIPEPLRTVLDRYAALLRSRQVAAVAATSGTRFVDIAREASPRFLGVPEASSPDAFHPSPIGYGFWADAIAPVVVAGIGRSG